MQIHDVELSSLHVYNIWKVVSHQCHLSRYHHTDHVLGDILWSPEPHCVSLVIFSHMASLQVVLNEVFQRYYEQDPINHAAPIPTVTFSAPVSEATIREICYAERYLHQAEVSDRDIRATAAVIITAALKLDSNADASAIQRNNPEVGNSTVRKYIIKRNHSGFARKVIRLTLDLSNWQPGPCLKGLHEAAPGLYHTALSPGQHYCETNQPEHKIAESSASPHESHESRGSYVTGVLMATEDPAGNPGHDTMPAAPADPSLTPTQDIPNPMSTPAHAAANLDGGRLAEGGTAAAEAHDQLHDAQQLLEAAERILRESCGEVWLLQPFIPDMGCNEYRQDVARSHSQHHSEDAHTETWSFRPLVYLDTCCRLSNTCCLLFICIARYPRHCTLGTALKVLQTRLHASRQRSVLLCAEGSRCGCCCLPFTSCPEEELACVCLGACLLFGIESDLQSSLLFSKQTVLHRSLGFSNQPVLHYTLGAGPY